MDAVTSNIAKYVKSRGINVSKMARDTGIAYMALYDSLLNNDRDRDIRGQELLKICVFLGVNPMDFADKPGGE
ncbi:MAG: helix-turn-helix transcriptional regulator [Lachnospiraceae bacterium]|nr:helix-turn-helix transcriptional regulator [Lachnospiraceae bacterium]